MALFSETFTSMDDLVEHQLRDLYDAEHRIHEQLPDVIEAVQCDNLTSRFREFHTGGERRIARLDEMFAKMNLTPKRETCEGTKGLLKEVSDSVGASGDLEVRDAAIIASYQRVAHYVIAGYGSARNLAKRTGPSGDYVGDLCQQSLDEAYDLDRDLTKIATGSVNVAAAV